MFFLGFGETCIRTEMDRHWRSEELLKLGGGLKLFVFSGTGAGLVLLGGG